jgi:hypothetical protein
MNAKSVFYLIGILVAALMVWIVIDTVSQPGEEGLQQQYEELGFYRNENNTGPVIRVYSVYASDTLWADMQAYGDLKPHTKYGNTKVFFFQDKNMAPKILQGTEPYFDQTKHTNCLAQYEKTAMGEVRFTKFPFNN